MAQGGFQVDKDTLKEALRQLEGARDEAKNLASDAAAVDPGELTAEDGTTGKAREVFKKCLSGSGGSLQGAANDIRMRLYEKIEAYKATLGEYDKAEDNADAATRDTERQS